MGTSPDLGGNPPTHVYSLFLYQPSQTVFPPGDNTYTSSLWNSGLDKAYTDSFFQVGYAVNAPIYANQHEFFIQTTANLDQYGYSYLYCEAGYGFTPSIGANGQQGGGCDATVENSGLGLVPGNSYWFEIYQSQDCAYGCHGCIYGCNGNTRFAINGREVGHMADCSSYAGMTNVLSSVVEPEDGGVTAKSATNLYSATGNQYDFHAIIYGSDYHANFLSKYCGYAPPAGAGSNIYSNRSARDSTFNASCTGTSAPIQGGSVGAAAPTPGVSGSGLPTTPPPGASPTPSSGSSTTGAVVAPHHHLPKVPRGSTSTMPTVPPPAPTPSPTSAR